MDRKGPLTLSIALSDTEGQRPGVAPVDGAAWLTNALKHPLVLVWKKGRRPWLGYLGKVGG
jgi:hypothetical protein